MRKLSISSFIFRIEDCLNSPRDDETPCLEAEKQPGTKSP